MATAVLHKPSLQSDAWLLACLEQVLKPIIRLFLTRRVAYPAFAAVAKRIYIELAREDAAKKNPRQPVTVSELAIATGVDTKTIGDRIKEEEAGLAQEKLPSLSPEAGILDEWVNNPTYRDIDSGTPLELPIRGKGLSFATLVRRTQRNVSYGHVLDTLLASGNVGIAKDGKSVKLLNKWYAPGLTNLPGQANIRDLARMSCRCIEHFVTTMNWNMVPEHRQANETRYQQEYFSRKIHPSRLREFRERCHEMLRQYAAKTANLMEPLEDEVRTDDHLCAGIGLYYFEAAA